MDMRPGNDRTGLNGCQHLLSFFPIRFVHNLFGEIEVIPKNDGVLDQALAGFGLFLLFFGCLGKFLVIAIENSISKFMRMFYFIELFLNFYSIIPSVLFSYLA
jgi:hypothetical protein